MKLRGLAWVLLCLACAGVILVWNASKLIGAPPMPRVKDLEFVPSAEVLKVLSVGHTNTVAKLRWIDSFSYLQLQFDKRDDTLMGAGHSGFERLYMGLFALDPKFEPFYNFAIMSESILHQQGGLALASVQRGLYELPQSMSLWRNLAALVKVQSDNVHTLDGVLNAWSLMTDSESERYHINRWRSQIGIFELAGLKQLDYWCRVLLKQKEHSALADMAESTLRQQLNNYALNVLNDLLAEDKAAVNGLVNDYLSANHYHAQYGSAGGLSFESTTVVWGPIAFPVEVATAVEGALARGEQKLQVPLADYMLRADPYGFHYQLVDGQVQSQGKIRFEYERGLRNYNFSIARQAKEKGSWPKDLAQAWEWLGGQQLPPAMAQLHWENNQIRVEWAEEPPQQAWDLRMMAAYWLQLLDAEK